MRRKISRPLKTSHLQHAIDKARYDAEEGVFMAQHTEDAVILSYYQAQLGVLARVEKLAVGFQKTASSESKPAQKFVLKKGAK